MTRDDGTTTSLRDETTRGGTTKLRDEEMTRERHVERQRNNQPARREDERAARGATRGQGEAMHNKLA